MPRGPREVQSSPIMGDARADSADVERRRSPDPVVEVYKRDVDIALIREQLRRTADERAQHMISALRLVETLGAARRGGSR